MFGYPQAGGWGQSQTPLIDSLAAQQRQSPGSGYLSGIRTISQNQYQDYNPNAAASSGGDNSGPNITIGGNTYGGSTFNTTSPSMPFTGGNTQPVPPQQQQQPQPQLQQSQWTGWHSPINVSDPNMIALPGIGAGNINPGLWGQMGIFGNGMTNIGAPAPVAGRGGSSSQGGGQQQNTTGGW